MLFARVSLASGGPVPLRVADQFAQRAQLLAPPQADHAAELSPHEAMACRVIFTQLAPAAVCHRHRRAAGRWAELDLDLGPLIGCKGGVPPRKHQPLGRLPDLDLTDLDHCRTAIRFD